MREAHLFVDWSFWVRSGAGSKKKKRSTKHDKRPKNDMSGQQLNHVARTSQKNSLKFHFNT